MFSLKKTERFFTIIC